MASAPNNVLPILYQDLIPLNSQEHADYKMTPSDAAPYLVNQHAVPLTVDEFISASRFLPIIFSAGTDPVPLVLMGLNDGINTIVDDEGKLIGRTYVPAYARRYPWMLARLRPEAEELSLCFDPTSPVIGKTETGEQLIDSDGKPTEFTSNILKFCEDFEQAASRTGQFMTELKQLDLLMDGEVSIQIPGVEQPFVYRGFQMVNEEKLRDMRGDQLRKIMQNGMLPLIHAHLFSLQLMREVFEQQQQLGKGPNIPAPQQPAFINA